jgi:Flp pilus assembly protein TadD
MGGKGFGLSPRLALTAVLLALAACSMPRVVVLGDPLSAREHVDLGLSYEAQGQLDLARREYLKAAAGQDDWATPHFNLGNIAYRERDFAAAESHFRKALSLEAGNPDIMNNLAVVLHQLDRDAEARDLVVRALAIRDREEYRDTLRVIDNGGASGDIAP